MGHVYLVCAQTKFCVNLDVQDNWFKIDKKFEEKVGKAVFCWQIAVFMAGQNIHLTLYSWVMHGMAHWACSQASFGESCAVYRRTSRKWTSTFPRAQGSLSPVRVIVKKTFCLRMVLGCAFEAVILYTHISGYSCGDVSELKMLQPLMLWVLTPKLSC